MAEASARVDRRLRAARRIFSLLGDKLDARISVRLWDGSEVPLGSAPEPGFALSFREPGVLASVLRRPTLENLLGHYACSRIDFHGGDLVDFLEVALDAQPRRLREVSKLRLLRESLPLLLSSAKWQAEHRYEDDETGRHTNRNERSFISFHYDVGNDFFALFLDPYMQYSCGYFKSSCNSLEQAQVDKLEMICRKLQLAEGERFLDVGCGWGGLVCHAAEHYGVRAHGVTLSREQYDYALERVAEKGLEDRVRIDLCDYQVLSGEYDKIASVEMYEHVGIANHPNYFGKLHSLLRDRGTLLIQGTTRRAKGSQRRFARISVGRRLVLKYVFPGSELDHIGHTLESMEAQRFEIQDVEDWREHYALTVRNWVVRLSARREEAVRRIGPERYRMWLACLAGVQVAFAQGTLRVYQTTATKQRALGSSRQPPTRSYLYHENHSPGPKTPL